MSGAITATTAMYTLAAAAVAGTAYSIYNGEQTKSMQSDAQNQAKDAAQKQATQADQALNRANQKSPDTAAILSGAQQSGKAGQSGTMLTGPSGVDTSSLTLGKNTLLGS